MWKDVVGKRDAMAKRYVDSTRHTIQVDFIPFLDELAELAGCKPNICMYCTNKMKILCVNLYIVLLHFQYKICFPISLGRPFLLVQSLRYNQKRIIWKDSRPIPDACKLENDLSLEKS